MFNGNYRGVGGFGNVGKFGSRGDERPIWKDLLLVSLPAFIASVLPIVVGHALSKPDPTPPQGGCDCKTPATKGEDK